MEVIKAHGLILGGVLVVDLERSELRQLRRPLASNWRPEAVGIVDLKEEDRAVEVVGCPRVEVVVGAPEARTLMSKPLGSDLYITAPGPPLHSTPQLLKLHHTVVVALVL